MVFIRDDALEIAPNQWRSAADESLPSEDGRNDPDPLSLAAHRCSAVGVAAPLSDLELKIFTSILFYFWGCYEHC